MEVPPGGVEVAAPAKETLDAPPAEKPAELKLAEGRFGEALDARVAPAVIDPNPAFRDPPLTVECWAKLFFKETLPTSSSPAIPKTSARHWGNSTPYVR